MNKEDKEWLENTANDYLNSFYTDQDEFLKSEVLEAMVDFSSAIVESILGGKEE